MPSYPHLYDNLAARDEVAARMAGLKALGVPYIDDPDDESEANYWFNIAYATDLYDEQAQEIVADLAANGEPDVDPNSEIVALTGYLLRLGRNYPVDQKKTDELNKNEGAK